MRHLDRRRPLAVDAEPAADGGGQACTRDSPPPPPSPHAPLVRVAACGGRVPRPDGAGAPRRVVGLAGGLARRVVRRQAELKRAGRLAIHGVRVVEGTLPAGRAGCVVRHPRQPRERDAAAQPRLLAHVGLQREAGVARVELDRLRDEVRPVAKAGGEGEGGGVRARLGGWDARSAASHQGAVGARRSRCHEAAYDSLERRRQRTRIVVISLGVIDL